jgi:hypothetical protein
MIFYQLCVTGKYACFESKTKISSKNIYKEKPNQAIINKFIEACCNSENPFSNLDQDTIEIKILELEYDENL